jgi:hypothetical protein
MSFAMTLRDFFEKSLKFFSQRRDGANEIVDGGIKPIRFLLSFADCKPPLNSSTTDERIDYFFSFY